MKPNDPYSMAISRHIWETRYRAAGEPDIRASWRRVAQAIAPAETHRREQWTERFATLLPDFRASWRRVTQTNTQTKTNQQKQKTKRNTTQQNDFRFLPGGRILAGAG